MAAQPYLLRDATDADREAIRSITLTAYEQYATALAPAFWEAYRSRMLARVGEDGPAERIVAERDGMVIGSVLLYPPAASAYGSTAQQADRPEIRLLAVAPAARGQGIGRALTVECLRRARRHGAAAVGLHTMEVMAVALQMYERMGFVREPDSDFSPAPGVLVKGYRLDLAYTAGEGDV